MNFCAFLFSRAEKEAKVEKEVNKSPMILASIPVFDNLGSNHLSPFNPCF
jgi:hypothetical protein